ncbi:hypothetical protein C8R45DRAFT_1129255 [Mycena sanguinolenta]|nr:hypothetical protein C8R45DRAFT_1129255 [Mycena sanguinolenta]
MQTFRRYHDNLEDIRHSNSGSFRRVLANVRSTHPCLRHFSVMDYHYGENFWVVYLDSATRNLDSISPIPLYVGRRPVYVTHGQVQFFASTDDILYDEIDPSLITTHDLQLIRKHFRHAYGVRVHRWGFMDVLFKTSEDILAQREIFMPSRIGGLGFACITSEHLPTSHSSPSFFGAVPPSSILPTLHKIDGISVEKTALRRAKRKLDLILQPRVNQLMSRFSRVTRFIADRVQRHRSAKGDTRPPDKFLTPDGVTVRLAGQGTMATDGRPLPEFSPRFAIARPEAGLHLETPAFILGQAPESNSRPGSTSEFSKEVLICGADYIFEGEHIKRSLIWRTNGDDHSMSGSVICLGKPKDGVQALLFQHFETPVWKESHRMGSYKGGFFLPEEVLDHAIIEVKRENDL